MASAVDIANLALAHLGDTATVASLDPPEGSAQAEHAARFYPIARNSLLELHAWHFATRRKVLAPLDIDSWAWAYAYAAPTNMVKMLAVLPYEANSDDETQLYDMEAGDASSIILTDQENAVARYIEGVTDTTRFSPLFVDALAWLLASYMAGPILKGEAGASMAKACYQTFMLLLGQARTSDANQSKIRPEHTPDWIKGR